MPPRKGGLTFINSNFNELEFIIPSIPIPNSPVFLYFQYVLDMIEDNCLHKQICISIVFRLVYIYRREEMRVYSLR